MRKIICFFIGHEWILSLGQLSKSRYTFIECERCCKVTVYDALRDKIGVE